MPPLLKDLRNKSVICTEGIDTPNITVSYQYQFHQP